MCFTCTNDPQKIYWTTQLGSVNLVSENPENFERKSSKSSSEKYSSRVVLSYVCELSLNSMNCHWYQWGFGWDEETNYKLCKLIQYIRKYNSVWSSVVPALTGDITGCPLSQLFLSVPWGSGESCCLLLSVFLHRRCIRNWDSITSHLSMSPLNWIVITVPFLLDLWSP